MTSPDSSIFLFETIQRVAGVLEVRTQRVVEVFGRKDAEDAAEDLISISKATMGKLQK